MNTKLSEQDRKAYEAYVLAENEEQRQEAIKRLIPGSHLHYHLHFIHKLKTPEGVREVLKNPEDQQMLEQFKKKYEKGPESSYYKQIESRLLLLSYDVAETEEERKKILEEITYKKLHLTFDDQKPDELLRAKAHLDSSSSQANDDDQSGASLSPPVSDGEEDEMMSTSQLANEDKASASYSKSRSASSSRSISNRREQRQRRRQRRRSYGSQCEDNENCEEEEDDDDGDDRSDYGDEMIIQEERKTPIPRTQASRRSQQIQQVRHPESDFRIELDIDVPQMQVQMQDMYSEQIFIQQEQIPYNSQFDNQDFQLQSNAILLDDVDEVAPIGQQLNTRDMRNHPKVPKTKKWELNYEKYFGKRVIRKIYTPLKKSDENDSRQKLKHLPPGKEHKIDFTKYNAKAVGNWALGSGLKCLSDLTNETFYQALKEYFSLTYKKDKHFTLPNSFCSSLSLIQLDKLATLHPSIKEDKVFIGQYFQKQFNEELSKENQEVWTNEEKRANLLHLYNYAKSKSMPLSLQSSLLIEVLDLGIKLNIYDEDLFRQYLAIPQREELSYFKNKRKAQNDNHWGQYIKNVQSENTRCGKWENQQKDFIKQYLEVFCGLKGSLESFKDEFDSKFLREIEERHQIYSSDDMTNLKIDLKKFQEVSQEVIIRFLESNQDVFKVQEEPTLVLELKNVQTLFIKIFEFNTETYYKRTLQPFNTSVNLDGLVASIEKQHQYSHAPNKKFQEKFNFPELVNKVGLFIVEFIGNGVSARAIIKKGSLSLIHRPTIAGHLAYIIDENQKVCIGPKTGVIFDGQYYKSDEEKDGKIFIPYGKSQLSAKAIQIHNDFAQLCDFERSTESYAFSAWIYVNRESLLIGNIAKLIIHPSLLINNTPASLSILKKTSVTLVLRNYIDSSIPITKKFENLNFDTSNFLTLDFQVPAYLQSVEVIISTEVFNVTLDQSQQFSHNEAFNVSTHEYDQMMTEIYLRKQKQEYYLYLLGKNGEPKPKQTIDLMIQHLNMTEHHMINTTPLITDNEGKVKLGHLKKVAVVSAICSEGTERTFLINHDSQNFTYLSNVDIIEHEICEFPITFAKKARKYVSLIKKSTDCGVLEDCYDKIEFIDQINATEGQEAKLFNLLKLNNLAEGQYILNLKNIQKKIKINVHKGQYWDGCNFVLKRNCLIENKALQKSIKIAQVKLEETKESSIKDVKIRLEDFSPDCRVFISAQQFENSFCSQEFWGLVKKKLKSQSATIFPFAVWKNIFMSNRELSDEYRYVFDRKYAERQLGNTLERPRLVLKRTFIQATTVEQQAMKQGTAYESIQLQPQTLKQSIQPKKKMRGQKMDKKQLRTQNIMPSSYVRKNSYGSDDDEDEEDCSSYDEQEDCDYRGGRG